MNIKLVTILAIAGSLALPTAAFAETDVFGHSEDYVISVLAEKGVNADRVEEYGDYILAFVRSADGGTSIQFFDATYYAPKS